MNVRKLMARLNANSLRYDVGRGGIPELTPQDIAGALGMVSDDLGREIFCHAWWPDGAALRQAELAQRLHSLLMEEFSSRYREVEAAKLEAHLMESDAPKYRPSAAARRARSIIVEAQRKTWPKSMAKYRDVAAAVMMEICAPRHCPQCNGKGTHTAEALVHVCSRCEGRGTIATNKVWRAQRLGISEGAYRNVWKDVYEWLYALVAEREANAARQIWHALGPSQMAA